MPRLRTAHKFSEKKRTGDVLTDEQLDFASLLLRPEVLQGLNDAGFEKPSPIQLKAIPLGRCGLDLIAQAKSGTGKTCVFSVIALENVILDSSSTQVLVLAPTREIAVQIRDVMSAIGCHMTSLGVHAFIGGIPLEEDKKLVKKCHIAVGSPGRIKFLIEKKLLKTDAIRLFILDEADKLLDESFQEQINWIFSSLPNNKQVMALSATYPEYLAQHLKKYMRDPTFVRLNATNPALQGIKQFYCMVPFHSLPHKTFQEKVDVLLKLLSRLKFQQCLVFSNYQMRAQSLCETLQRKGWPAAFIAGSQTQTQRLKAMDKLKQFRCRVLISTDLTARGIDAEHVNLVVNMDVPRDTQTLLHRIGRAGRFGTRGIAVTFVASGDEEKRFRAIEQESGVTVDLLPDHIPESLYKDELLPSASEESCANENRNTVEVKILQQKETMDGESQEWGSKEQVCSPTSSLMDEASGKVDSYCVEGHKEQTNPPKIGETTADAGVVECDKDIQHSSEYLSTEQCPGKVATNSKVTCDLWCIEGEPGASSSGGKGEFMTPSRQEVKSQDQTIISEESLHCSTNPANDLANKPEAEQDMLGCSSDNSPSLGESSEDFLPSGDQFDKDFDEYLTKSFTQQLVLGSDVGSCDNSEEVESVGQLSEMLVDAKVSQNMGKVHRGNRDALRCLPVKETHNLCSTNAEQSETHNSHISSIEDSKLPVQGAHWNDNYSAVVQQESYLGGEEGSKHFGANSQPQRQLCSDKIGPSKRCLPHSQRSETNLSGGMHFNDAQNQQCWSWWDNSPSHMPPRSYPHSGVSSDQATQSYTHKPSHRCNDDHSLYYPTNPETSPLSGLNFEDSQQPQQSSWERSWNNAYVRQCNYLRAFQKMRFPSPYQYGGHTV